MKKIVARFGLFVGASLLVSCGGEQPESQEPIAEKEAKVQSLAKTAEIEPAATVAAVPAKTEPEVKEDEFRMVNKDLFVAPDGLEVTVWATSPLFYNPTNMDIDKDGRIWVAEGVRYRREFDRQPEGDRIVVVEDTDNDGKADSSHTFVQEPLLIAPLGVAVMDNKIVVSQPPHLLVYTDEDRNLKFDPEIDKREILLTGFMVSKPPKAQEMGSLLV